MDTRKKITKLIIQLIRNPDTGFFGSLLLKPELKENNDIKTARIHKDLKSIEYNKEFIDNLEVNHLKAILLHEILHPALQHPLRKENRDMYKFNIAADIEINSLLTDNGFVFPPKHILVPDRNGYIYLPAEMFKNNKPYDVDNCYKKTAEQIYAEIPELSDNAKQNIPQWLKSNPEDNKEQLQEWKKAIVDADTIEKDRTGNKSRFSRLLDKIFNPIIPWYRILSQYLTQTLETSQTWKRPDRKSYSLGFYLPSYNKNGLEIDIWIDSSISITERELGTFIGTTKGLLKVFPRVVGKIHLWHTEVYATFDIKKSVAEIFDKLEDGGTTIGCINKYLHKKNRHPHLSLVYTDGYIESNADKLLSNNTIFILPKNGKDDLVKNLGKVIRKRI